ncbi:hypothetical protein [Chitinimonas arctica]|nr:hypothetical protein [Chitinimonas arctica]
MNMDPLSHYLRPPLRHAGWLWLLVAVLLIGAAWLAQDTYQVAARTEQLAARSERLQAQQRRAAKPVDDKASQRTQKQWAALQAERDYPWPEIFLAIERAGKADVELLEFQPDKTSRQLILRGEARDRRALEAYLDALAGQAVLNRVHLSHQQTVLRERLETVEFEIKAVVVGPSSNR